MVLNIYDWIFSWLTDENRSSYPIVLKRSTKMLRRPLIQKHVVVFFYNAKTRNPEDPSTLENIDDEADNKMALSRFRMECVIWFESTACAGMELKAINSNQCLRSRSTYDCLLPRFTFEQSFPEFTHTRCQERGCACSKYRWIFFGIALAFQYLYLSLSWFLNYSGCWAEEEPDGHDWEVDRRSLRMLLDEMVVER